LRTLNDRKGQGLINGVLGIVDRYRPLHLSIVGGDPLLRYRELETMIPAILDRGVHVQVVTSAFRPLSPGWPELPRPNVVVSIDGLQARARRAACAGNLQPHSQEYCACSPRKRGITCRKCCTPKSASRPLPICSLCAGNFPSSTCGANDS
jgi:hypothetical protein